MKQTSMLLPRAVKLLTLFLVTLFGYGCSTVQFQESPCKSRAYIRLGLEPYITQRFDKNAPVRLGVIPFSVPANLTGFGNRANLGNELAWRMHAHLVRSEATPIVEIFPREDWPGKQDEFFRGNFGALAHGREAGYDLILVGLVDQLHSLEEMTAHMKIIDVESGVTVFYGSATAHHEMPSLNNPLYLLGVSAPRPDLLQTKAIVDSLSECMAFEVLKDEDIHSEGLPEMEIVPRAKGPAADPEIAY